MTFPVGVFIAWKKIVPFPRQSLRSGRTGAVSLTHGSWKGTKQIFIQWLNHERVVAGDMIGTVVKSTAPLVSIKLFCGSFWEKKHTCLKWVFYFECLQNSSSTKCSLNFRKIESRFIVFHTQNFPIIPPEQPHPDFPSEQIFLSFCEHVHLGTFWATSVTCCYCRNLGELSFSGSQYCSHLETVEMVLHFQSRFGYSLFDYLIVVS